MKKIIIIIGTRPELIKLFPVYNEFKNKNNFKLSVCFTGQHEELIEETNKIFQIPFDKRFNNTNKKNNLNILSSNIIKKLNFLFLEKKPDLIIVQGDTTTTMISSICAFNLQIPIAYIESGLRTYNLTSPFPEEANRQIISRISNLNFCPTKQNYKNLKKEKTDGKSYIVGNTVIDAIKFVLRQNQISKKEIFSKLGIKKNYEKYILITAHRRENFGQNYLNIINAINQLSKKNSNVLIVFISHPNPNVQNLLKSNLIIRNNVCLMGSLNYLNFIFLIKHSYFVISDSGGIQEEISILNKPLLMIRNNTERSEGIKNGFIKKVGTSTTIIVNYANKLLSNIKFYKSMINKDNPFGDGKSSVRIYKIINNFLK